MKAMNGCLPDMPQAADDRPRPENRCELYGMPFNRMDAGETLDRLLGRDPAAPFAYVVTPNVDHVVRVQAEHGETERAYREAWLSVCDSAVLSLLSSTVMAPLPVVPGSDLVEALVQRLDPGERLTIIGCEADEIAALRHRHGFTAIAHHNPPMGMLAKPGAIQACVDFVLAHPARFVFLAVGSPQQEVLACRLHRTGRATGIGLCIGSSLHFLTGVERRAPSALRGSGLEWAFRLAQDPRRLWRRYLVRGPAIFRIAARHTAPMLAASALRPFGGTSSRAGRRRPVPDRSPRSAE